MIEGLRKLEESDLKAEGRSAAQGKKGVTGILCIAGGILAEPFLPGTALVVCPIGVGLIFLGLAKYTGSAKYDLENMRYCLPLELLETISLDLNPEREISLKLDFRPTQTSAFVTKVDQSRNFLGFASGTKVTQYLQPWLELEATTILGHKVHLAITRRVTRKETPKRKRTKIKIRQFDIASVTVRPCKTEGPSLAGYSTPLSPPRQHGLRSLSGHLSARGASIKGVSRVSGSDPPNIAHALKSRDLLAMLMTAFRGLAQASKSAS